MKRMFIVLALCGTVAATGCFTGSSVSGTSAERSTGELVDDSIVVTRVKSQLLADPEISGLKINVDSYEGVVTLKGFVKSGHEADEAIRLAKMTPGVREVRSNLVVE